jgi:hypothetical protein
MKLADFRKAPKRPDCRELLGRFTSLGLNCEFGLVQRHCEAEPLGLLRFAFSPLPSLINALKAGFDGIGNPDELAMRVLQNGEYMATHTRYGFEFHTTMKTDAMDEADARARIAFHVGHLASHLRQDMAAAERIFVYRPQLAATPEDRARKLHARMAEYGPVQLLWAAFTSDPALVGTVHWLLQGEIMVGYLDHYSPPRYAANASFDVWLQICARAAALRDGLAASQAKSMAR